MKCTVNRLTFE